MIPVRRDVRRRFASFAAALVGAAAILVLAYALVVELGSRLVAGLAQALVLVPRGIVWVAMSLDSGVNGWAIAGRAASAAVGMLAVPTVAVSLLALELVAAGALFALRTLLRNEARRQSKEINP
jgi:hypothetical protein